MPPRTQQQSNRRRAAPAGPAAPPKVEIPADIDPKTGKKDWSRYNATVVGAVWDLRAPAHPAGPPGLPAPPAAATPARRVAWLGERRVTEEPGAWIHVGRGGKQTKSRSNRRSRAPRPAEVYEME